MKGILADVNIQGYVDWLVAIMRAEPWKLFWDHLELQYFHFADLGLVRESLDSLVWEKSQSEELALITDNRNNDGPDSLEATIQARSTPQSLPVFTIGKTSRLRASRDYAEQIIDTLFDALLRIDTVRGIGRLYLP